MNFSTLDIFGTQMLNLFYLRHFIMNFSLGLLNMVRIFFQKMSRIFVDKFTHWKAVTFRLILK
jgi:hypothetical protein